MSEPKIPGYDGLRKIGSGGSSTVYRAADPRHGRDVAIKVLNSTALDDRTREAFLRELQVMGHLGGHPNIVSLHDSGFTNDGYPYMVMPLYTDGTYNDRHPDARPMSWPAVIDFGVKLAAALEACHRQGVIHRDIKPSNVFVGPYEGQPILGDFGISSLIDPGQTFTEARSFTLGYAAPEVLDDERPTPLSDIYSLGATLFYLLDGHAPFTAENQAAVMRKILSDEPAPQVTAPIPQQLRALVAQLLAKAATARPRSALDVAESLRSIQAAGGLELSPVLVDATAAADQVGVVGSEETTSPTGAPLASSGPVSGSGPIFGPGSIPGDDYGVSQHGAGVGAVASGSSYNTQAVGAADWPTEPPRDDATQSLSGKPPSSKSRVRPSLLLAGLAALALVVGGGVVLASQRDGDNNASGSNNDTTTSTSDPAGPESSSSSTIDEPTGGKLEGSDGQADETIVIETTVPPDWAGSTFTVWVDTGLGGNFIDGLEAAAENADVTFELQELKRDQAMLLFEEGESPDFLVANSAHEWFARLVGGGYVNPVELEETSVAPIAIAAATYEGDQYAYPYAVRNVALFRNTDLVEDVPSSFDSLVSEAKGLVEDGSAVKPMAIPQSMFYQYPLYTGAGGYLFGEGEDGELNPNDIGLDSAQGLEAARQFDEWVADGLFTAGADNDSTIGDFANGDVPFMVNGPWAMDVIDKSDVNYAVSPIPNIKVGEVAAPFVSIQGVFLTSGSAQADNVLDFVEDFFGSAEGQLVLQQSNRLTPASTEALAEVVKVDSSLAGFYEAGLDGHPSPNIPEMNSVWGPWSSAYESLFAGDVTGEEAFAAAGATIRQRVEEGG